jgi:hypothetical protein
MRSQTGAPGRWRPPSSKGPGHREPMAMEKDKDKDRKFVRNPFENKEIS